MSSSISVTKFNQVFFIQKKWIRIILNLPSDFTCRGILKNLQLLSLPYNLLLYSIMYIIVENKKAVELCSGSQKYSTRDGNLTKSLKHFRGAQPCLSSNNIVLMNYQQIWTHCITKRKKNVFRNKLKEYPIGRQLLSVEEVKNPPINVLCFYWILYCSLFWLCCTQWHSLLYFYLSTYWENEEQTLN